MNYYISDYHLGFERVSRIDKRTFKNDEERNCTIISNWNSCVKKDDTVYILGDFIWSAEHEDIGLSVLRVLKGNKYLVTGNHDQLERCDKLKRELLGYSPLLEITDNNISLVLCHYPILFYPHQRKGGIMLHGHVHSSREQKYIERWQLECQQAGMHCKLINVGCMMPYMNFTPKTLDELDAIINQD